MTGLASSRAHSSSTWRRADLGVGRLDGEADGLAHPHFLHATEAEGGQGPLDGGALGVGDARPQAHFDEDREAHARHPATAGDRSPPSRLKGFPVSRSYADT